MSKGDKELKRHPGQQPDGFTASVVWLCSLVLGSFLYSYFSFVAIDESHLILFAIDPRFYGIFVYVLLFSFFAGIPSIIIYYYLNRTINKITSQHKYLFRTLSGLLLSCISILILALFLDFYNLQTLLIFILAYGLGTILAHWVMLKKLRIQEIEY